MLRRRGKAPRRSELTAFIDEGSEIEGRYTFRGTVMLNGKFKGEISSNDTLIIGERAVLHADVRAGQVVVSGEVTGQPERHGAGRAEAHRPRLRRRGGPGGGGRGGGAVRGALPDDQADPGGRGPHACSARDLAVVPLKR